MIRRWWILILAFVILMFAASLLYLQYLQRAASPNESYGMVIVIDGARGDVWKRYAQEGRLPNVKRLFLEEGVWVEHASAVFPTITGAGLPAALTGTLPGRHGIPSLYFFDRQSQEYPVLYALLEALDWNQWLSPEVMTIWEYFPGANDTMAIGPALNRGADSVVPVVWNLGYKPMEYRAKVQLGLRQMQRGLFGGQPARLTVVYNGWFDHMEHSFGATNPMMDEHYRAVDDLIGEAVRVFNTILDERQARIGKPVKRYVALVSDHGHQDIKEVYSIDKFVRGAKGAKVLDKVWSRLFGVTLRGSMPDSFEDKEIVVAAGEGHALLYFPTPVLGADGMIERLDWSRRPGLQLLRNYPYSGGRVNVLAEGTAWKEAVAFMVGKDWATGKVHVFSHLGESVIVRKGNAPTRALYQYQVVEGKDPLGFDENPAVRPLLDGSFHHADEWQVATYLSEHPDAMVQLFQAFDAESRAPDLYLSASPHISIGDLVDGELSASKHGGLTKEESWATVAFHGSGVSPMNIEIARTVDVVPTILYLLEQPYDPEKLDGKVIPQIREIMERRRLPSNSNPLSD